MGLEQYAKAFEQLSERADALEKLSNEIAIRAAVFKEAYTTQQDILEILFKKRVNIELLLSCDNYIQYNEKNISNPLTSFDFYLITKYYKTQEKTICPE